LEVLVANQDGSIERLPWVTWSLALVWTAAFVASLAGVDPEAAGLGLDPADLSVPAFGAHWVFHANALHWLVSTALLVVFGPHLEDAWGKGVYAPFLLASLVVAAGAYAFLGPDERPLVGASSAIAAIVAAVLVRHGMESLPTYVMRWNEPSNTSFEVPAIAAAGVWFVGEILMTVTSSGTGLTRGVGPMVPLCGALVGGGFAFLLQRGASGPERRNEPRLHPALASAQAARDSGHPHHALSALEPAVRTRPHDTELVRALCDAAIEANEANRAAEPLRKLIVEQVRKGEASGAAAFWRAYGDKVPGIRLDPRTAIDLAIALAAATEKALAARVLRDTLASQPRLSPGVALRLCEVAAPLHRETAIKAGRMALAAEGLDDAKRTKLEARIAALEAQAPSGEPDLDVETPPAKPVARRSAPRAEEPAPQKPLDRTLDIDLDPDYAPVRPKELPPPPPEMVFELSADGDKIAGDTNTDYLSAPLPDTEPIVVDPAEVDAAGAPAAMKPPEPDAREELAVAVAADQARFHELKCIEAVPTALDVDGLALKNGPHVDLARVDAIGVGGVQGMAAKPVLLIDLLLNWSELGEGPLRSIRLRSDHFDPRALFPDAKGGLDAFRMLVDELLARSGATPLPDSETARGKPFKMFPELAKYEREVLQVER
jgi:membrane associated rhomboid family serine protease